MSIYTPPPPLRTFAQDKPTLIVAWWCTLFASVLILFRVIGQLVRLERLQAADTMALLTIPALLVRMAAVHVVLLWGTGNADFSHLWTGDVRLDSIKELAGYSGLEGLVRREEVNAWGMGDRMVYEREMGSRMVLMARIFFPICLWLMKFTIFFFVRSLIHRSHMPGYHKPADLIGGFIALCLLGPIISLFTECRPFNNYWQLLPDPGGECRQGFANLIVTGAFDVVTDICLVILPIPVLFTSAMMGTKDRIRMMSFFSLSLVPVAITLYRIPSIISHRGTQAHRSLWASIEILFAAAVANGVVLAAQVRDKGAKKAKWNAEREMNLQREREFKRPPTQRGEDDEFAQSLGVNALTLGRGMWEGDEEDVSIRTPANVARLNTYADPSPRPTPMTGTSGTRSEKDAAWRPFATRQRSDSVREEESGILSSASDFGRAGLAASRHPSNASNQIEDFHSAGVTPPLGSQPTPVPVPVPVQNVFSRTRSLKEKARRQQEDGLGLFDVGGLLGRSDDPSSTSHLTARPGTAKSAKSFNSDFDFGFSHASTGPADAHDRPPLPRAGTNPVTTPFHSHSHTPLEPGTVTTPRSGTDARMFLADVSGLLDEGPGIMVSPDEVATSGDRARTGRGREMGDESARVAAAEMRRFWDTRGLGSGGGGNQENEFGVSSTVIGGGEGGKGRGRGGLSKAERMMGAGPGVGGALAAQERGRGREEEVEMQTFMPKSGRAGGGLGGSRSKSMTGRKDPSEEMDFIDVGGLLK